eukprot:scaffold23361_cov62-Attheya_sp.AAC.1
MLVTGDNQTKRKQRRFVGILVGVGESVGPSVGCTVGDVVSGGVVDGGSLRISVGKFVGVSDGMADGGLLGIPVGVIVDCRAFRSHSGCNH